MSTRGDTVRTVAIVAAILQVADAARDLMYASRGSIPRTPHEESVKEAIKLVETAERLLPPEIADA